jgi:membrane protein
MGLVISLWSANSGIKALFVSLNVVYQEDEKRGFVRLNTVALSFTLATIAFLLLALACVVVLPVLLNHLPVPPVTSLLVDIARWPILLVLLGSGLTLIYRYGPSRAEPRWQWITWGGAFAAIVWLAGLGSVLVVCGTFRELQQNLWFARRHHRVHDLDVAVDHCGSGRREAQCRDRAPDGARKPLRPNIGRRARPV